MKLTRKMSYIFIIFIIFINISGWLGVSSSKSIIEELAIVEQTVTITAARHVLFSNVLMGFVSLFSLVLLIGWFPIRKKTFKEEQMLFSERTQMISILDSINAFIYISDPNTYEILYANKIVRDFYGENLIGETCYKKFQRINAPCEFCTNDIVLKDNKNSYQCELHNTVINQDFLLTDKIIHWSDSRDVKFRFAVNITAQKSIHRIDEVIRRSNDIEKVMKDILDAVLSIYDCDGAYLLYPQGSEIKRWEVKFTESKPNIQVLQDSEDFFFSSSPCQKIFQECQDSKGQVLTMLVNTSELNAAMKPVISSTMQIAIFPEPDKPLIFCVRQFSEDRNFTSEEKDLFKKIGDRIAESLNKLKLYNELKQIEEKYRMLFDSVMDGVILVNKEGQIIECSISACELLAYSKSEIIGKNIIDFMTPDSFYAFMDKFPLLKNLESVEAEIQLIKKDKTIVDVWRIGLPLKDLNGVFTGGLLYDHNITIRKQLRKQLVRSERLSATGQLAASIAHEINSPLQAISFMLDTIKKRYKQDKVLSENIDLLKGSFNSIRDTVRNLLDLNRPGQEKRQPVRINHTIEKTVALFKNQLKKNSIKVNLNLSFKVPVIEASPQLLSQVFLNLIKNAVEAMSGKLKKGHPSSTDVREITIKSNLKKGNVLIRFSDSGMGISEEDLNKIFDPFYTRKKTMGLGVGLSICHDIIKDHNGSITAENTPEGGALFTITLPVNHITENHKISYGKL